MDLLRGKRKIPIKVFSGEQNTGAGLPKSWTNQGSQSRTRWQSWRNEGLPWDCTHSLRGKWKNTTTTSQQWISQRSSVQCTSRHIGKRIGESNKMWTRSVAITMCRKPKLPGSKISSYGDRWTISFSRKELLNVLHALCHYPSLFSKRVKVWHNYVISTLHCPSVSLILQR